MSQANDPWREDRLGRLLRDGLLPARMAAPDPKVWHRIASQLEARPSRLERLGRGLGLQAGTRDAYTNGHFWVSLRAATVLSLLVIVAGVAVRVSGGGASLSMSESQVLTAAHVSNPYGLSEAELAIQQEIVPRPIALTLPSSDLDSERVSADRSRRDARLRPSPPQETYVRSSWLRPVPEPRWSPAVPLDFLDGP